MLYISRDYIPEYQANNCDWLFHTTLPCFLAITKLKAVMLYQFYTVNKLWEI